jgi:hypothetical protein
MHFGLIFVTTAGRRRKNRRNGRSRHMLLNFGSLLEAIAVTLPYCAAYIGVRLTAYVESVRLPKAHIAALTKL